MKRLTAPAIAAVLAGCAITSSYHEGPNGRPVHFIDGMSASAAYAKAAELCPGGYTILGAPDQKTVLDYMMTIECGAPAVRQTAPAPAPRAEPHKVGRFSYSAEQLPEVRACNPYPVAQLNAQGDRYETFTVACTNGDALAVRCENTGCWTLR